MKFTARLRSEPAFAVALLVILGSAAVGAVSYVRGSAATVTVDDAQLAAPVVQLAPQGSGALEEVEVHEGDLVPANFVVARVGTELVKTKIAGEIVGVRNDIGKLVNRGEAVVTMIDRHELRVVARLDEDKGLDEIRVGQVAHFTVDAFGDEDFVGVVDEIAPTSREAGVTFAISDKRETKEFEVKIRFNVDEYPELKNGMSAKVVIRK